MSRNAVPVLSEKLKAALHQAAVAEVQAIAIYQAEVFWIRKKERAQILQQILVEERSHGSFLAHWSRPSPSVIVFNRVSGWALGTFLALLPWSWLCRIQAWAETQAQEIYLRAMEVAKSEALGEDRDDLIRGLLHSAESEGMHSNTFKAPQN
ncbi:MAG: demethoxyubiquinone hydroxylase family protein [Bdellovibrionales bacterium]|nr:demethoxyubiquinone hydroxylase family protein [Bdellovibrionales bacterium]